MPRKDDESDLLWGVEAIAKHIRRGKRQTQYLLYKRKLPFKKLSHRIVVASRAEIDAHLKSET